MPLELQYSRVLVLQAWPCSVGVHRNPNAPTKPFTVIDNLPNCRGDLLLGNMLLLIQNEMKKINRDSPLLTFLVVSMVTFPMFCFLK